MRRLWSLKRLREERAMSQRELAAEAGVSQDTIGQLERGEREAQHQTVKKLARALEVGPPELMKKED